MQKDNYIDFLKKFKHYGSVFNIALIVWGAQHSNIDPTNGFEGGITYFSKKQQMDKVFCKQPFYLQFHLVLQVAQKLHAAIWFLLFL